MHTIYFLPPALLLALVGVGCTTPPMDLHNEVKSASTPYADREQCLSVERSVIAANSKSMSHLFRHALDNYDSAMPCIGASAKLKSGLHSSACDGMPMPYELQHTQTDYPLYKAGLRDGDIIDSIDDQPIRFPMDFEVAVMSVVPTKVVNVKVVRLGKVINASAIVGIQLPGEGMYCNVLPVQQ
jgi:hypothetical protein